jgi:hypothetical protein
MGTKGEITRKDLMNALRKTEQQPPKKPAIQFSKKLCMRSWWLMAFAVVFCMVGEFVLQLAGRGSMIEVVTVVLSLISFVTVFIQGGYITQNVLRDTSLNKHGIHLHEGEHHKHYMEKPSVEQPAAVDGEVKGEIL